VKRRKNENSRKPRAADPNPPVFSDYILPLDFEDALMIAIANSAVRPKRKTPAGRSVSRRTR
jgi:hypothetical protein